MLRRFYHWLTDWPAPPEGDDMPWQAVLAAFIFMDIVLLAATQR
jgi:hypothetical protein